MNENTNVIAISSRAVNKDRALARAHATVGLDLSNVRGLQYIGLREALDLLPNGEWQATAVAIYAPKKGANV